MVVVGNGRTGSRAYMLSASVPERFKQGGVQHDQGEVYQKPITFSRVSQSGQVEIKIGYLYCQFLYPKPNTYNLVYGA